MPIEINVDDESYQEQAVTLNGITFYLTISYNSVYKTNNWVIDVLDSDRNNLYVGKRITPFSNISSNSLELIESMNGYLFAVKLSGKKDYMDRNNFGTGKDFRLWYYSKEELG